MYLFRKLILISGLVQLRIDVLLPIIFVAGWIFQLLMFHHNEFADCPHLEMMVVALFIQIKVQKV